MSYAYESEDFAQYYDKFVEDLPDEPLWISASDKIYRDVVQRTIDVKGESRRSLVIELGCGTGESLISLAKCFSLENVRLIGIDHSRAMLDAARKKCVQPPFDQIELYQGNLTNFASLLSNQLADCILLPAGTFHHLITDQDRHDFFEQIRRVLRPQTGLCAIYLLPQSMIYVEFDGNIDAEKKFQMIASENRENSDGEWICDQRFAFNGPTKNELSWQLRTCSPSKLIDLLEQNTMEIVSMCVDGQELINYDQYCSLSSKDYSTPVIVVAQRKENPVN